jgi:uncharacterized Zn-binding protein involved in type VI secretion
MASVHRQGDTNTAGAPIESVQQQTVFANKALVSVNGSAVADHGRRAHDRPFTANGSATVFINNIPVNKAGDPDTCGHTRAQGSPDVNIDG